MDPSVCNVNADYLLIVYVSCGERACVCVSVCVVTVKLRKYAKNNIHILTHSNIHTFARAHTNMHRGRAREREGKREGRKEKRRKIVNRNNKLNLKNTETQRNEARGWKQSVGAGGGREGAKDAEQSE